jgi:hypothetical protein
MRRLLLFTDAKSRRQTQELTLMRPRESLKPPLFGHNPSSIPSQNLNLETTSFMDYLNFINDFHAKGNRDWDIPQNYVHQQFILDLP